VLIAEGCQIRQAEINDSIVGLRSQINEGVRMTRTVLMGADYYDPPHATLPGNIPIGIGQNCYIEGAIIDKNARLGEGVVIKPFPPGTEIEEKSWVAKDGIVVIPKNTILHAGTNIGPE
jgi:glucose-1-phosphate adenylyltransferase